MAPAAASESRFRALRELGRGGMGAVELVWDALREEEVARKRCQLRPGDGSDASQAQRAFARLKREFRTVAELSHPSLVPVLELGQDEEGVFFTMQAVDGVDLYAHCREAAVAPSTGSGFRTKRATTEDAMAATLRAETWASSEEPAPRRASTCRYDRLAEVLPSLLEGLAHLHARGLVHRDLKPSNVLVDRSGRARILDFGILAELSASPGEMAGTPAYMAPEQIRGAPPAPSMDLYALGVTLFELVAGAPPFRSATAVGMIGQHLTVTAPRLADRAPDVPEALDRVVASLLQKDPASRPSLAEVAREVLPPLGASVPALEETATASSELVGREDLERRLAGFLDRGSRFEALVLEGPSGVGKSALVRWAAARARQMGHAVFAGRARPTELLPFNAIDGIVDALDAALPRPGADARVDRLRAQAAIAFPALGAGAPVDAGPLRTVAFDAVNELLGGLARARGGVLLVVDDVQWADADSRTFLAALAAAAPANVRLIATCRDDLPSTAHVAWIDRRGWARWPVPPLDAAALGRIAARAAGGALDPALAQTLVASCGGRAYLAEVAGHLHREGARATDELGSALAARLAELPAGSRVVLAALAAADGWVRAGELADGLSITVGAVDGVARALAGLAVVRRSGAVGRDEHIDLYHDVARAAAVEVVGQDGLRDGHAALAAALSGAGSDPLRLVRHLAGAGRLVEAANRAESEARRAEARRAYGLCAELYALGAKGLPERALELGRLRALALIRGGMYDEAVAQLDALEPRDDAERAELLFERGYALAMAGRVREGLGDLDRCLVARAQRPLARSGLAFLPDALRFLAGPPSPARPRDGVADDPRAREHREREAEIALLLTWEEPVAAVIWAHRVRQLADRAGRPERGAFAEYVLAFQTTAMGAKAGPSRAGERYLASARGRAAPIADEPSIRALDEAVVGLAEFRAGSFRAAAERFRALARSLEEAGRARTHNHLLALSNTCGALMCAERPDELAPTLDALEAACPAHAGAMDAHVAICESTLAMYRGERARYFELREALRARRVADGEPRFHHLVGLVLGSYGELLFGDPVAARRENAALMREGRAFRPMGTFYAGAFAGFCAQIEAAALRRGDPDASIRRIARCADIARKAPPLFGAYAIRALAYAEDHRRRPERALALLREAEAYADRWDGPVSRAIARYQLGRRLGGDEGAALMEAARRDVAAVGAKELVLDEDRS